MIRLKREHYAVGAAERYGVSATIGISYEASGEDDVAALTYYAQKLARLALVAHGGNHAAISALVQLSLDMDYPNRPFYVETDEEGRGVQVYQPYGMPQDQTKPTKAGCQFEECGVCGTEDHTPLRASDGEYW